LFTLPILQPRDLFAHKSCPVLARLRGLQSNRAGDRRRLTGRERRVESPTIGMEIRS